MKLPQNLWTASDFAPLVKNARENVTVTRGIFSTKTTTMNLNSLRAITIVSILIGTILSASAQKTISGTGSATASRESVEERLVQLALNKSFGSKVAIYETQMAEGTLKQSKMLWFDKVRMQGNLNEFTIQPDKFARSQFFPRYNFSVGLSFGDFAIIPQEIKRNRAALEIARLGVDSQKLAVRTEVLRKYNHYLSIRDQLSLHKRLESETELNLGLMKTKFDKGDENYQNYSIVIERHYNMLMRTKELEEQLEEAKIDLEAMIDTPLETVL